MAEQEPITEQTLLERMQAIALTEDVAKIAVRELKKPEEMALFFVEYANSLKTSEDPNVRKRPFEVAAKKLVFNSGIYNNETIDRWISLLGEYPVFNEDSIS